MSHVPTPEEMIDLACNDARVPLGEVKSHAHGKVYELDVRVLPREPECSAMLQLADPMMLQELRDLHPASAQWKSDSEYPFMLVCRRANNFMNSVGAGLFDLDRGRTHTPAYMHPQDLEAIGISEGALIEVRSRHGVMMARVEADDSLRVGLVSVVHGFGGSSTHAGPDDELHLGSVTRLVGMDERDPISGIPRMSALPIAVKAAVI